MSAKSLTAEQQLAALERLAAPKTLDNSLSLTFSRPELTNIGQAFVQLTEMGYATRKKLDGGWCKFKITRKGRDKWNEVQRG